MDDKPPQRDPGRPGTRLRIGPQLWEMSDPEWETWVRQGRVPPDSLVFSPYWTRGFWRRADSLEVYHLYRPDTRPRALSGGASQGTWPGVPGQEATPARELGGPSSEGARPSQGLPVVLWGPGVSVTQVLFLANTLVAAGLVWYWRGDYSERLWAFSGELRALLLEGGLPVLFVPLFLHAGATHLVGNMVGLAAAGAVVEEFYGRGRTLLLYLFAGLCGAGLSLLRTKPVLSVGASGAIMGLYGVALVFLLRYRHTFPDRQRWKAKRVYFPLLVLALLPSLFQADMLSHVGGFVGGILLALLVPPIRERLPRPEAVRA